MAQTEKAHARTASTDQRSSWSWRKLFGKDEHHNNTPPASTKGTSPRPGLARRISRKVVPGLPRPGTFKRQQSELRDRLVPAPTADERRTLSVDRRRNPSVRDSSAVVAPNRLSAPELQDAVESIAPPPDNTTQEDEPANNEDVTEEVEYSKEPSAVDTQSISTEAFDELILEELEKRWILNLSMHFRDKSKREKFFVTYAETPTHWRRVTISLDYRTAPEGSLEEELQKTRFQRDKSARIYEAIRESLPDIQFYDTVTNLKLQTENERLHVHVVEDLSEIISYPPVRAINHLNCRRVREQDLVFDSHLSGFVYKVNVGGQVFIKKEIPGPDTVDEFLYEINALHQLSGSRSVIQFGGVVLDNKGETVKGLLISFAEQGALIDVIYDGDGTIPWARRERWSRQIVQGLSEIHEAGFVQGDFTLSNIVIDADDNAKIIDINRRGCPVGWEPPEVAALIDSNQRISMYIGVKSDLYQLGMVLFALATQLDEPENHRPFNLSFPDDVPEYFLDVCRRCLSDDPRDRSQAYYLLTLFPEIEENYSAAGIPIPIVVDARYPEEEPRSPYQNGNSFQLNGFDPHFMQNPGLETPINVYDYAVTDTSEEADYFPRRGRSPPASFRYEEAVPSEIPLPRSSSGSSCQDVNYLDTPSANNTLNFSTLASLDEYQQGTQDVRDPYAEDKLMLSLQDPRLASIPMDLLDNRKFDEPERTIPDLPSTPESMKPQNIPLPPETPEEMQLDEQPASTVSEPSAIVTKPELPQILPLSPVLSDANEPEEGQESICPDPLGEPKSSPLVAILASPSTIDSQNLPEAAISEAPIPPRIASQPAIRNNTQSQATLEVDTSPNQVEEQQRERPQSVNNPAEWLKGTQPEKVFKPVKEDIPPTTTPNSSQSVVTTSLLDKLKVEGKQEISEPGKLLSLPVLEKPGYAAISSDRSNHFGTQDSREVAISAGSCSTRNLPAHRHLIPHPNKNLTITHSEELQKTAAAHLGDLSICPNLLLAGIGSGHTAQFGYHPANLDDDFTTDMPYDRIAETGSTETRF